MADKKLKPKSKNDGWAALSKFIDFLTMLAPSADKDMKANIFVDGSIVLMYVFLFKFLIEPAFQHLEPLFRVVLVLVVLFGVYHVPIRAIMSCYNLFIKKLGKKKFDLQEL